jgi:hypothetical protein
MEKRSTRENVEATISAANKKAKISSKDEVKTKEMDGKIMKVMLMFHMEERFDIKAEDVANELGVHIRTKSFRKRWGFLKNEREFIGLGKADGLRLTKEGLEEAATPEYKEMMKELSTNPNTNDEHQERIKKYVKKPKSVAMLNLLLEYGTLTKAELSALLAVQAGSHGFFYSLQELRVKGYVEEDPYSSSKKEKKFRLSDKSFLKAKEYRSKKIGDSDAKKLAAEVASGLALMESRKRGSAKSKSTKIKEEVVKEETE